MAWCHQATSLYLNKYWSNLCYHMASLCHNELMRIKEFITSVMSCCNNPNEHIFNSVCHFSIGPIDFTDQTTEGQMKISFIPCYRRWNIPVGPMKQNYHTTDCNSRYMGMNMIQFNFYISNSRYIGIKLIQSNNAAELIHNFSNTLLQV